MSTTGSKAPTPAAAPVGPKLPPVVAPADRSHVATGADDAASYNEVPYPSFPFRKSHPDQIHMLARLFGLQPTEVARCRVLEIGCAGGGNIIPMADQIPGAEFVGLDYSEVQIREAQQWIDRSGLENIRVLAADVSTVSTDELGTFDYIVCHGVYSWVPPVVQNAILDVCHKCLNPHGVAFVSFNTYPGWHFRGMIRDMMRYHVQQFKKAEVQINQARALLKFLAENANEETAYGKLLKTELETLSKQSDSYLYHEHLESHNQPVYFHHFAEDVKRFHLQYLGDAEIATMWLGNFAGSIAETIQRIAPDLVQQEQYADFLRNRTFRQALLCHEAIRPERHLGPEKFADARFSGRFRAAAEGRAVNLAPGIKERFTDPASGSSIETSFALVKAALVELGNSFPASVSMAELWERSLAASQVDAALQPESQPQYRRHLVEELVKLFVSGLIEVKYSPDYFVMNVSERPKLSRFNLDQAQQGVRLTSRRHELVTLDLVIQKFAQLLNGARTQEDVVNELMRQVETGELTVGSKGQGNETDLAKVRDLIKGSLADALRGFARNALLIA